MDMTLTPSLDADAGASRQDHQRQRLSTADYGLVRVAREHGVRSMLRLPISVVVSGFLFAFVSAASGALWLAVILGLEALSWWIRARLGRGDLRYVWPHLGCLLAISLCWVVHAQLLWRADGEVPHIAAIMDLFTVALYGAIGGHKDQRLLVVLVAPPLLMLVALLGQLAWTTTPPLIAAFATLATLGSCATIVLNGFGMHRSDRDLNQSNAALEQERAALDHRVRERTAELSKAMVLAQEANIAKSQFLANMSHELRTPLNAMIGYAEILEEDLREVPSPARSEDAARIASAARTQLALVNDILDMSRIDAGGVETTRAPVEVMSLLEDVVQAVSTLARENGNAVSITAAGDVPPVMTDGRRLRQCVLNLAANACKFTKDGHVRLAARITGDADRRWLEIGVADTGCGIAADQLERLFEPFVQVDATATRKYGGAGLGLVITRSLIELLGGGVAVRSAPGAGSTFTLRVPA